ncbi:helix-turn-helix domain-containing protein [Cellulosilyticum ruminicola]|uniref:helix-turn-helix domain-containing protein n=1 Tax=Cellulosilyticum ruminicola TaxID=425254 RepID=UPI0006CFA9B0|nr:helix-turn-helix domain-containing protein [Cellulosilyticum ruminicola]
MLQEKDFLTVKDVAEKLETEAYVLRFYEKELNLNIKRNSKGHRVYTLEDVEMFRKILEMREQGLQLKAIEGIMHDSNKEIKESYEQLSSTQFAPTTAQTNSVTTIDIDDPNNEKVKAFMGMITQAVIEGNKAAVESIRSEMRIEINREVDKKMNMYEERQDAKNEEYYRKLDETMREVQKMRKELGENRECEKIEKQSFLNRIFKGKKTVDSQTAKEM